jgi:hypothetical protein
MVKLIMGGNEKIKSIKGNGKRKKPIERESL